MKKEFSYDVGGEIKTVTVADDGDRFEVTVGDTTYSVAVQQPEPGQFVLEVDGRRQRAYVAYDGSRRHVALAGGVWMFEEAQPRQQRRGSRSAGLAGAGTLEATMPGLVLDVLVAEGDSVKRGDTLVLLEAMKMELRISSPCDGRVRKIQCAAGEVVERGQTLVEVTEERGGEERGEGAAGEQRG